MNSDLKVTNTSNFVSCRIHAAIEIDKTTLFSMEDEEAIHLALVDSNNLSLLNKFKLKTNETSLCLCRLDDSHLLVALKEGRIILY